MAAWHQQEFARPDVNSRAQITSCRLCGQERHGDPLHLHYHDMIILLTEANGNLDKGSEEHERIVRYAGTALYDFIEALSEDEGISEENSAALVLVMRARADAYMHIGEWERAVGTYEKCVELLSKGGFKKYGISIEDLQKATGASLIAPEIWLRDIWIEIIRCRNRCQNFFGAIDALKEVSKFLGKGDPQEEAKVMRNWYHFGAVAHEGLGNFEFAIDLALLAIEMNRHYDEVY